MKPSMRLGLLALCLTAGLAGCDVEFTDDRQSLEGAMTSRQEWRIVGTGTKFTNLRQALDGNVQTAARTATGVYSNASVTIDLGQSCVFNLLILYHGDEQFGFSRNVTVETSTNGRQFVQRQIVPGLRKVTYVLLPTWTRARFVRITGDAPAKGKPWTLAEIYIQ